MRTRTASPPWPCPPTAAASPLALESLQASIGWQVTGGMEGEVRVWNIGLQTQTMDASLKAMALKGQHICLLGASRTGVVHQDRQG